MWLVVDSTATSVRVAASAIGVIFSRMKAFLDDAGSLLRELRDRARRESIVLSGVSVTPQQFRPPQQMGLPPSA
jgi:hypothetical protein